MRSSKSSLKTSVKETIRPKSPSKEKFKAIDENDIETFKKNTERARSLLRLKSTTSSLVSVGLGYKSDTDGPLQQLKCDSGIPTSPERVTFLNQRLTDVIQFYIICPSHKKILLTQSSQNQSLYFPFTTIRTNETVFREVNRRIYEFGQELEIPKDMIEDSSSLIDMIHLKIPPNNEYINRFTFRMDFKPKAKNLCICSSKLTNIKWYTIDEIKTLVNRLWGPEPLLIGNKVIQPDYQPIIDEISLEDICKYFSPVLQAEEHPLTKTLTEMNMKDTDLERLWIEFLVNCYPSVYMTRYSLQDFISRPTGLDNPLGNPPLYKPEKLLRSFKIDSERSDNFYIDFDEFLFGLCFMDPVCQSQEVRVSYLFRYYGQNQQIIYDDLLRFCSDMELFIYRNHREKNWFDTDIDLFAGTNESNRTAIKFNYAQFLSKFKSNQMRNSRYFNLQTAWRLTGSLRIFLRNLQQLDGYFLSRNLQEVVRLRNEMMCVRCMEAKSAIIAEHTIKVSYSGIIKNFVNNSQWISSDKRAIKLQRLFSQLFFLPESFSNILLKALTNIDDTGNNRAQVSQDKNGTENYQWSPRFTQTFLNKLLDSAQQADKLLIKEQANVLRLKSPVVVVPASHVKLMGRIPIEQYLTYLAAVAFPFKFVIFLEWSNLQTKGVELLFHWIAHKLLLPKQYFLVFEGNQNEFRSKLMNQIKEQFPNKSDQLSQALMNILNHSPKMLVVDDTVCVIQEINSSEQIIRDLVKQYQTANPKARISLEAEIEILTLVVVRTASAQDYFFHVKSYESSLEMGGTCKNHFNVSKKAKMTNKNYMIVLLLDNEKIRVFYF